MPPKRMTANPVRPARYRPGKLTAPEAYSSEEEEEEEEDEDEEEVEPSKSAQQTRAAPPPKASSFPSSSSTAATDTARVARNLDRVDLNERRRQEAASDAARREAERISKEEEEGFVTEESESGKDEAGTSIKKGSSEDDDDESEEEDESSEEEAPKRPLVRPTFIKKDKRQPSNLPDKDPEALELQRQKDEEVRQQAADELIQEQLRKTAEARAAGHRDWDDEDVAEIDAVDDTDDIDPEAERAAWKLRELRRVKRDREAIEEAEREREELERRRNLTVQEREAEDQSFIAAQREEHDDGRGKMGYMQKYFHKGAFFQEDAKAQGLDRRDIMGSRYQDDVANRELLPQYMQIRDMTRLGKKGRTKYKDLKSEDTGRWADYGNDRKDRGGGAGGDERFMPDKQPTGANASVVRERRQPVEGAPAGPKAIRDEDPRASTGGPTDTYRPSDDSRQDREEDENRSVHREHHRRPRRSYSRSRSRDRSPRRDRVRDRTRSSNRRDRDRRKRSPSPYSSKDRGYVDGDKRRRLDVR